MKKTIIYLLVLSLFLLGSSAFAANYFDKPRLSVRAFDDNSGGEAPAAAITEMMTTELHNAGLFTLVEREKFSYVRDEIELGLEGWLAPETAPEVGRIIGAQYSMTGAITQYFYNATGAIIPVPGIGGAGLLTNTGYVTIDLRVINNETGEVVYATAEQGAANQTLGGIATRYGGFGTGRIGGVLAAATRKAVVKHVDAIRAVMARF